jgi:hypothetical protein
MRLSDSFESIKSLGLAEKESPSLELVVKVLNINEGKNSKITSGCQTLAQYSAFIAKMREYEKAKYTREEAVKKAVTYCKNHAILSEFLDKNASEVLNMLMTEWNWDDALAVRFEEGREEGREELTSEIAQKMKDMGYTPEQILTLTGQTL